MSRRFASDRRAALYVLGAVVTAIGLFGLVGARRLGFTEAQGREVVDVSADFMWGRLFAFNPLGALCFVAVGVASVAAGRTRLVGVAVGTAGAALLLAVVTILQLGTDDQVLGSRAGNASLLIAVAVALLTIAVTPSTPDPPG